VGDASVIASFTPFVGTKGVIDASTPADLAYCSRLIDAAQEGALFFFFNPGPRGTLIDAIAPLQSRPNFYIRGVVNQDPNPADPGIPDPANPHVQLLHRGQSVELPDEVAMPSAVNEAHSYWLKEQLRLGNVLVHSKLVVLDPFGANPVVMTGSHNDGTKASLSNDENLIIVQGDAALAQAFAVNVITIFNQYWWRYNRFASANAKQGTPAQSPAVWPALVHDDSWQKRFLPGGSQRYEVEFWA
jgi:phosphatidylserine/phosphatidylglycerophosphate/cardiolipin synthase-like enzyme